MTTKFDDPFHRPFEKRRIESYLKHLVQTSDVGTKRRLMEVERGCPVADALNLWVLM